MCGDIHLYYIQTKDFLWETRSCLELVFRKWDWIEQKQWKLCFKKTDFDKWLTTKIPQVIVPAVENSWPCHQQRPICSRTASFLISYITFNV